MVDSFRAYNTIVDRYQYFNLKELRELKGNIQWHIIIFEQSTGLFDKYNKEIFEGDFFRIEDDLGDGNEVEYYVITWIKEWSMFGSLSSTEWQNYKKVGAKCLDEIMFWSFPLDGKDIDIIGSIRDKKHKRKLQGYLYV
jgi:hypothetical protein